jgi:hypothetical protein
MKILKDLIEHGKSTLDEVENYVQEAYVLMPKHKSMADAYVKIAETHISIFNTLHEKMIMLINEEKAKGETIPSVMEELWKYEHNVLMKEFAEAKYLIEEYKKMGY